MTEAERLSLALKGIGVVRHDLRNLLASMEIVAERMAASDDKRLKMAGPHLVSGVEQVVALTRAIQDLAEVERQGQGAVSLFQAATEAVGERDGVTLAGVEGVTVRADHDQLVRLLRETIDNPLQLGARVTLSASEARGRVTIEVADDGPGIPDYAQDTLFVPFRGARRKGATGLGLPIAAAIAEANGGALRLKKTGSSGTVLEIDLPAP
ncbi:sensor histidine kinase [Parvularcula oceani]|uniref:sensor histidine kinase n=1 Tax=Parvularcula oceani TaxID=1247963 RepID=UPI0004E10DBE|nr:HAMP domain-containing sensor histidine kinase [Parvularcula oceani]